MRYTLKYILILQLFIKTKNLSGLNIIALAYIGLSLLMWTGQYLETLELSFASQGILFRLRTELFNHLHRLSLSFFDRNKVGTIMSRVQSDVQQLQQLITGGLLNIITSALTLLGISVVMVLMDERLALLTLTVLPAELPLLAFFTAPLGFVIGLGKHYGAKPLIVTLVGTVFLTGGMLLLAFGLGMPFYQNNLPEKLLPHLQP